MPNVRCGAKIYRVMRGFAWNGRAQLAETPGASQYVRNALEGQARSILKKIETAGGDTGAAGGRSAAPAPSI